MGTMAVAHRAGMDFCGDKVNFVLGLGGKTLEEAREFCRFMWGGPVEGDIAILKDGIYYVCDGINPDTDNEFTTEELEEIKSHFDEGAVIFL